jgi:type IV pilus assembly protein PilN
MAKVNLLPWRAARRKDRQQKFFVMLGVAAGVAVALGLAVTFYYSGQIDGQNNRNSYLTDQIKKLDDQIKEIEQLDAKKDKLLRRKDVIETLQANRSTMVHMFDELVRTIPDGVRLTSVKQDGSKLTLEGQSQSNARVSAYMRNIEASGWMNNPDLSVIEAKGDDRKLPYAFSLSLTITKPGQVLGPDGKPVLGPDGKPMMSTAASGTPDAAASGSAAASPAASPATTAAPATVPAPAPATKTPAAAPAASSKGGATP